MGIGAGFGIAGLIAALLGAFLPFLGLFVGWVGLALATVGALFGDKGFAIATANEPEILLIDEVLAVGDIGFQQKCYQRIGDLKSKGSTIVLVSHFLSELTKVCDRGACMEKGKIVSVGSIHEIGLEYHRILGLDQEQV